MPSLKAIDAALKRRERRGELVHQVAATRDPAAQFIQRYQDPEDPWTSTTTLVQLALTGETTNEPM